jgi:hypothetical protein
MWPVLAKLTRTRYLVHLLSVTYCNRRRRNGTRKANSTEQQQQQQRDGDDASGLPLQYLQGFQNA